MSKEFDKLHNSVCAKAQAEFNKLEHMFLTEISLCVPRSSRKVSYYSIMIHSELLEFLQTRDEYFIKAFAKLDKLNYPLEHMYEIYMAGEDEIWAEFGEILCSIGEEDE